MGAWPVPLDVLSRLSDLRWVQQRAHVRFCSSLTANLLCGQEAEQTGRGRSFQVDMDSSSTCREEEEEETR